MRFVKYVTGNISMRLKNFETKHTAVLESIVCDLHDTRCVLQDRDLGAFVHLQRTQH